MKKRKNRFIMASLFCIFLSFSFCSISGISRAADFGRDPVSEEPVDGGTTIGTEYDEEPIDGGTTIGTKYEEEPIDGGTTNRTDYHAPKKIESSEIIEFDAEFCLFTRWKTCDEDDFFHFQVKNNDEGVLTASEEILGISGPADNELLAALQEIIVRNNLAEMNGVYEITAGLSPEYEEGGLTVRYASGESINFTTNNNPYAIWAEEVYDVFAAWFAENGDDSLYPPKEDSPVTHFRLELTENGIRQEYYRVNVLEEQAIDGETSLLCRWIYDTDTLEDILQEYMLFPKDYYESIGQILAGYDFSRNYDFSNYNHDSGRYDMHDLGYYGMGGKTPADGEEDCEDKQLSLHVYYESGHKINIDTAKESEIEAFRPMVTELIDYHDYIFSADHAIPEDEQFSIIINEPDDPEYSYIRCDYYLGSIQFGYQIGCPDTGETFTHFDFTADDFAGIEGEHDISAFHIEISIGYNGYSAEEAVLQAMMGNMGESRFLASLQFTPELGVKYEYRIIRAEDGYTLEEVK